MKLSVFKWILLLTGLLILWCLNIKFEVFALNNQAGHVRKDDNIRVMTYNVNATLGDENIESVKKGLVEEIYKHNPDILCLQELSSKVFEELQTTLDSLFNYTDSMVIRKKYSRYKIYSNKPLRNFKEHLCKSEIDTIGIDKIKEEIEQLKYGVSVYYSAEIMVEPDRWITVLSCHLCSSAYTTARRSMEEGASWLDGIPLYYKNYKIGQKIRNWEADNLRLHLDSLETEDIPVIIAGDFNDWSGSYCMNTIRDGKYKDAWWEGGVGLGITYDEWHLKLRLDHILYSHHFKLENVYVEKTKFSDHRPLVADFTLKDPH